MNAENNDRLWLFFNTNAVEEEYRSELLLA